MKAWRKVDRAWGGAAKGPARPHTFLTLMCERTVVLVPFELRIKSAAPHIIEDELGKVN